MAAVALVITILGLIISVYFNLLQLKWRREERDARAEESRPASPTRLAAV